MYMYVYIYTYFICCLCPKNGSFLKAVIFVSLVQ